MTQAEFCTWLSGYLTDRDKPDADVIRAKLGEVLPVVPVPPMYPVGPAYPLPIYPDTNRSVPAYPKGWTVTCTNMVPLGADFQRAIFSATEALYEN